MDTPLRLHSFKQRDQRHAAPPPHHTTRQQVYISIQYQVIREKVYDAVYKLTSPQEQVCARPCRDRPTDRQTDQTHAMLCLNERQTRGIHHSIRPLFVHLNPHHNTPPQIRAYVYDVVRATLPRMNLDEAFESKDEIAHAIKTSLSASMGDYGFSILNALVTVQREAGF